MLICCRRGENCLRCVFWGIWCVTILPLRLLEICLINAPLRMFASVLSAEMHKAAAGLLTGSLLSFVVFLPVTNKALDYPSSLCSCYMTLFAWALGAFAVKYAIFARFIDPVVTRTQSCLRVHTTVGGWLGFLAGIAFAAPLVTFDHPDPTQTEQFSSWCRPSDRIPLFALVIPAVVFSAIANLAEFKPPHIPPNSHQPIYTNRGTRIVYSQQRTDPKPSQTQHSDDEQEDSLSLSQYV